MDMTIETIGDVYAMRAIYLMLGTASIYLIAVIVRYFVILSAERVWARGSVKALFFPWAYHLAFTVCYLALWAFLLSVAASFGIAIAAIMQ
jgi:hypothetical protein